MKNKNLSKKQIKKKKLNVQISKKINGKTNKRSTIYLFDIIAHTA